MSYLILNKRDQFYFHGEINCSDIISEIVCGAHSENCVIKNNDGVAYCTDKCRFDPANVTEDNYESFNMVKEDVDGITQYYFENEETNGIFSECLNKCREIERDGLIEKSECDVNDCQTKCQRYLTERVESISKADIKFKPYPTNRLEQSDYNRIKDTVITQMTGDFKQSIQDTIFQDSINTEISSQVDIQNETEKLNNVLLVLKNLNSTGNNFIQQVDQLGEFQDKYSQKIEELLEEKKSTDTNLDMKISLLQDKLERLNEFYNEFNTSVNTNTQNAITQIYKSATCLANGITLNLIPVVYTKDSINKQYRNGVYCISLSQSQGGTLDTNGLVYVEPLKTDADGVVKYCNPYESGCSYKLLLKGSSRDNDGAFNDAPDVLNIDLDSEENIKNIQYPDDSDIDSYSPLNYQFKKQAYFHVREIKSKNDYNAILINTPSGSSNLIRNEQIKYPFFVIESLEMPGYLINLSKNSTATGSIITLNPANKGGSEKFKVSSNVSSDPVRCT